MRRSEVNVLRRTRVLPLLVLLVAPWAALSPAEPAAAHSADPRIVTVIDSIEPPLPAGVVVQVQASIATQLVAGNSTATGLEVLAESGEPFLSISSSGVRGNLASPSFYATSNPVGSAQGAPADVLAAGGKGVPRFVAISRTASWGWYDHRLHPAQVKAPADATRPARLSDFTIGLRYGDTRMAVRGHVEFRPLLGSFLVTADLAPDDLKGVTVQVLQSNRLPGLFLTNSENRTFTILGRDDEPFARFGPSGLEVNAASRTRVEDQQARGAPSPPPSTTPRFELLGGVSLSWLDTRLRYVSDAPPQDALRREQPTTVGRWQVPVDLGGKRTALTGEIRWVPTGVSLDDLDEGRSVPLLVAGGLAAGAVLAGAVVLVRRASRRTPSP